MYNYNEQKSELFTDEGQRSFLRIRDRVRELLKLSGAVRMQEALTGTGSNWTLIACVDRMVELGELREINQVERPAGQYRVFVATRCL